MPLLAGRYVAGHTIPMRLQLPAKTCSVPTSRSGQRVLRYAVIAAMAWSVAGCSFLNDAVWPTISGSQPPERPQTTQIGTTSTVPTPEVEQLFDAASFNEALEGPVGIVRSVAAKEPDYRTRLDATQQRLASQAQRLQQAEGSQSGTGFDRWATAQIELTRLNDERVDLDILADDIAADSAAIATAVAQLTSLGQVEDIASDEATRLTNAGREANRVLVRLGTLHQAIKAEQDRWAAFADAQTSRIGVRQAGAIIEPGEMTEPPKTSPQTSNGESLPASGDRFIGRKPLMSVNFTDPDIAYKDRLRALMQQVQAQYPDVALEIEVVGVDADEVGSVTALLDDIGIEASAYRTMLAPDAAPMLRFFPR